MRRGMLIGLLGLGLVSATGCGSSARQPVAAPAVNGFQTVIDQLESESKLKSVNGTTVTLAPVAEGPDGHRVVTARRERKDSTTVYTLEFQPTAEGWVCCQALADETGPGSERSTYRLSGQAVAIDQLMIWLGW